MSTGRVRSAGAVFVLAFGLLGYRLADLQISPSGPLAGPGPSPARTQVLEAGRGQILDRWGRSLAVSRPSASVVADPQSVPPPAVDRVVQELSRHVDTDPDVLRRRLTSDARFVYIDRQIDPEIGEEIAALRLPGVWIIEEPRREYPNGSCSARSLLGRVDTDEVGISGLEKIHDELLTGTPGESLVELSRDGRHTIAGGRATISPPSPGEDLVTSLDRDVQYEAERLMTDAVDAAGADWGIALVMIPSTGELVASASVARDDATGEVGCTTSNLPMTETFEPGSTMKAISGAIALDRGVVQPDEPIEFEEWRSFPIDGGRTFTAKDWFGHDQDAYTLTEIITRSSNVGSTVVADRVGPEAMHDAYATFGFGEKTALGFPGEAAGILRPFTSTVALPTASYGQGVGVTALQLLTAYDTLANGGVAVEPSLARGGAGQEPVRVISEVAAREMLEMLRQVVASEDGTGRRASVPGYNVAGKTGTAWQVCGPTGYDCDESGTKHYTASFAGIVSNDLGPAFTVLVVIDNPNHDAYSGGTVAAPVFADLAAYAAHQLRVAPLSESIIRVGNGVRAPVAVAPEVAAGETGDVELAAPAVAGDSR